MVSTGKLAVISVLALLGLGSLGGGWYVGNFVGDALEEGIEDSLVIDPNFETDDPEDYADWLTNEDEDDPPKYKRYYFWNLTNPNEYLSGTNPMYEEIGPYAYRQFDIKINVEITDTTVKYQTYTYYVFDTAESFVGASETDKIVNVNPAYIGVIAGAGSEQALAVGFVGPTMASIFAGLAGDFTDGVKVQGAGLGVTEVMSGLTGAFADKLPFLGGADGMTQIIDGLTGSFSQGVIVKGMPEVLETVQAGVTFNLHLAVNGSTSVALIEGMLGALEGALGSEAAAWAEFFNGTNTQGNTPALPIQSIGEFNGGAATGINDTAAELILNQGLDFGPIQIEGWLSKPDTGQGVLEFLGFYQVAANVTDVSLDKATLASLYKLADTTQLDKLANFLSAHLIDDVVQTAVGGSSKVAAEFAFYDQWANGNVTGALDLDLDNFADGFEVAGSTVTNITLTDVQTLWDSSNALALTNESGIETWFGALFQNPAALAAVGTLGMNATQLGSVLLWLGNFSSGFSTKSILNNLAGFGINTLADIGYFHWGNGGLTEDISVSDLDDEILAPVEFWNITSATLSAANVRNLMTGAFNLTDPTGLGTFMQLGAGAAAGDPTSNDTANLWFGTSLVQADFIALMTYLNSFLINGLVLSQLPISDYADAGYYQWGDGDITGNVSLSDLDDSVVIPIEYWNITSSSLSLDNSRNLTTGLWNLTTTNGVGAIFTYANASAGDVASLATINALFETTLTANDTANLLVYLDYVIESLVVPTLNGTNAEVVTSSADIAYLHWGSPHVTGGKSVHLDLDPESTLPGYPEFWAWAANVSDAKIPYTFGLNNSKAILNSLTDSQLVGLVLLSVDAVNSTDATTSATALGTVNFALGSELTKTDFFFLAGYLQYLMEKFVIEFTLLPIFAADGDLITDRTITEWLWEYDDPLLAFLEANGQVDSAANNFFTSHDNNTDPRISYAHTFNTGGDDINDLWQYEAWQGLSVIYDVWDHPEVVNGTDATQFHPGVEEDEVLKAWVSELMRTVDLVFEENVKTEGIDLLRFGIADSVLAVNPAFDQTIEGVANMTAAIGAPLFVSKPHFLDAVSTASTVGGLAPVKDKHDLFIDIEPTSGAVMNAAKRLQISFQVGPGNLFTPGIAKTDLLPIVWIEEGGVITADLADDFKDVVYGAQQIEEIAPIGGAAVGIVLLLTSMFIAIRARKP